MLPMLHSIGKKANTTHPISVLLYFLSLELPEELRLLFHVRPKSNQPTNWLELQMNSLFWGNSPDPLQNFLQGKSGLRNTKSLPQTHWSYVTASAFHLPCSFNKSLWRPDVMRRRECQKVCAFGLALLWTSYCLPWKLAFDHTVIHP